MFNRHGVPKSRIEVLGQVPFFAGLPPKVIARIDSNIDEVTVPKGHMLTEQGRGAFEAFIIADGVAEVQVNGEVVGETTVGEMIGEIGILRNALRSATVTATTPMRLLVVNPQKLDWLFDNPTLKQRLQENLDHHLAGPQP